PARSSTAGHRETAMSNRFAAGVVAGSMIALGGCVTRPPAPAPQALHVPQAPTAVVQTAAHQLVGEGFEVTQSDAAAGVLTARLATDNRASPPLLTCFF